jgi:predicted transcriptional regulator
MSRRLQKEEIVTIRVLAQQGMRKTEIARQMGVTEGAVRYHLRREAEGAEDGRKDRTFKAEAYEGPIREFVEANEGRRPVNVRALYISAAKESMLTIFCIRRTPVVARQTEFRM